MSDKDSSTCDTFGSQAALLILRLWIGLRLFFAGIEKFRGKSDTGEIELTFAHFKSKMAIISEGVSANSMLPKWMCDAYAYPLPFLLTIVGIACLVGIFTRLSLLLAGLLFLSLAFGVMVLPDDTQSLYLGLHVAICAFALCISKHHWLSLDWILGRKK